MVSVRVVVVEYNTSTAGMMEMKIPRFTSFQLLRLEIEIPLASNRGIQHGLAVKLVALSLGGDVAHF